MEYLKVRGRYGIRLISNDNVRQIRVSHANIYVCMYYLCCSLTLRRDKFRMYGFSTIRTLENTYAVDQQPQASQRFYLRTLVPIHGN